jgi:hypothetical protein
VAAVEVVTAALSDPVAASASLPLGLK